MRAAHEPLSLVFGRPHRFVVPIFQRPYVWTAEANWTPLWQDLRSAAEDYEHESTQGENRSPKEYFLGAFVTQSSAPVPRRTSTSYVIDGQQRMTTLQVFLAAARRAAAKVEARDAEYRFGVLTRNSIPDETEHPEDAFKVTPLRDDRAAFAWALRLPADKSAAPDVHHRLVEAADFFEREIVDWIRAVDEPQMRLDALHYSVENRAIVVSIFLDPQDDPQVIFEALNYRGVSLYAADLIKNSLFQTLEQQGDRDLEEELLENHWRALDSPLWRKEIITGRITRIRVDQVIAYWLSAKRREETSVEHLFRDFKNWMRDSNSRASDVIIDIRRYADTMDRLENALPSSPIRQIVDRLVVNKTTTAWPIILFLHATAEIPAIEAENGAKAIDSFLMRRAICKLNVKDYNRFFAQVLSIVATSDLHQAGQILVSELASQTAPTRLWPSNSDFTEALTASAFYKAHQQARIRSLLLGIENHLQGSKTEAGEPRSPLTNLTIEHVLPQKWQTNWKLDEPVSDAMVARRDDYKERLGNLTLLTSSLNGSVSNNAWTDKRRELRSHSLLRITTASILSSFMSDASDEEWVASWDEDHIEYRSLWLTKLAWAVWPRPDTASGEKPAGNENARRLL